MKQKPQSQSRSEKTLLKKSVGSSAGKKGKKVKSRKSNQNNRFNDHSEATHQSKFKGENKKYLYPRLNMYAVSKIISKFSDKMKPSLNSSEHALDTEYSKRTSDGGDSSTEASSTLFNVETSIKELEALYEFKSGNYQGAMNLYELVLNLLRLEDNKRHLVIATVYVCKGDVHAALNDWQLALNHYKKALKIRMEKLDESSPLIDEVLRKISHAIGKADDVEQELINTEDSTRASDMPSPKDCLTDRLIMHLLLAE